MLDPSIKNSRGKKRIRGKKQKWSIKNNAQVYKKSSTRFGTVPHTWFYKKSSKKHPVKKYTGRFG